VCPQSANRRATNGTTKEWLSQNSGAGLPEGEGIKSCEGFKHLGVQWCDTCHNFYAHDEMSVIDLPDGGKGRVCDPVKWAIIPRNIKNPEEWSRNSPEGKLLRQILGLDTDNN
jgi:hypothetical protein